MDSKGSFEVHSQNNISCSGDFIYFDGQITGIGVFECNDGRAGDFRFSTTGEQGVGGGRTLTGEDVEFFFKED